VHGEPTSLSTWRRTPADAHDFFTDEELARARRYQRPLRLARWLRVGITVGAVTAVVLTGAATEAIDAVGAETWIVQLAVVFLLLEAMLLVIDVPFDLWVDFAHDRRWELSTQRPTTFVADQLKSFLLSTVLGLAILVPLYWLMRTTGWWWLIGWLLATALGVVFGFLYPVLVAPLFNRFEPLDDRELVARLNEVAAASGTPIAGVLVADESRRSRRDNAYVSGLGATRRVVLFDTILEHPPELIDQVVAHELGHWRRHHLRQQIPVFAATTLVSFVALAALGEWDALWTWLGIAGIGDPASLPVLLVAFQAVGLATGLVSAYLSRAHERQADLDALDVLRRPADMVEMLRRLHVKNVADLDPGRLQRLRMSHPPAAERMAFSQRWQALDRGAESFTSM
jgi:STE24 endopeptidase